MPRQSRSEGIHDLLPTYNPLFWQSSLWGKNVQIHLFSEKLEDPGRSQDDAVAGPDFSLHKGNGLGASGDPGSALHPLSDPHHMGEIRGHSNGNRAPLSRNPDSRCQDPIAKGHQHAAMDNTMGIAVSLYGAKAVGKSIVVIAMKIGSIVCSERAARPAELKSFRRPGLSNFIVCKFH
jgi:hypothetical protein